MIVRHGITHSPAFVVFRERHLKPLSANAMAGKRNFHNFCQASSPSRGFWNLQQIKISNANAIWQGILPPPCCGAGCGENLFKFKQCALAGLKRDFLPPCVAWGFMVSTNCNWKMQAQILQPFPSSLYVVWKGARLNWKIFKENISRCSSKF